MTELLGKRITALRSAKGLTRKRLAKILSVSTDFLLTGCPEAPAAEDKATLRQLICSCVLPFGGKICFEPCCKPHSLSATKP